MKKLHKQFLVFLFFSFFMQSTCIIFSCKTKTIFHDTNVFGKSFKFECKLNKFMVKQYVWIGALF